MNLLKNISGLLVVMLVFISCNETKDAQVKKGDVLAHEMKADIKKVSLDIEGMTCEIGCARTIQSKLSKKEGVKFAEVSFSERKGVVEFDANKISKKEIVATVEKIAGGDLYKVTHSAEKQ